MIRDRLEDDLGQTFGDGLAHPLPGFRIHRRPGEALRLCFGRRPLRVAVPDVVGAAMKARPQRAALGPQQPGYARPRLHERFFRAGMQAPAVNRAESRRWIGHIAKPGSGARRLVRAGPEEAAA